jgi:tRNA/rRNA methyltransferase
MRSCIFYLNSRSGKTHLKVRVVLVEPEKEGNIGSVARAMKNFDLDDLWIVNPKIPIDGEARAYAMHGLNVLMAARVVRTFSEALEGAALIAGTSSVVASSTSNLLRLAITPRQMAERIKIARKGTVAIMFGRESSGLNNQELEACDFLVTIPASRNYNVLNIATAAAIVFYEIFQLKTTKSIELAANDSRQRLLSQLDSLMKKCGTQPHRRRLAQRAFRNIISRSLISRREASLLIGVFRKTLSKTT